MIKFEHDFQHKVMHQEFIEAFNIDSQEDINKWKLLWLSELKSWHSPYKLIINCENIKIKNDAEIKLKLENLLKFFKGLHLRSAIGYGYSEAAGHKQLPFEVVNEFLEAKAKINWRDKAKSNFGEDFRSQIRIENHLRDQIVELSFEGEVQIDSIEQISTIKSKLLNNLMSWHSPWNLLIDCFKLRFKNESIKDFEKMIQSFKGLHLRQVIGYQPNETSGFEGFKVFRSRHKAVANLESDPTYKADIANCSSRKEPKNK